jgi:hypothetical protein
MKILTFICILICPGIFFSQKLITVAERTVAIGANKTEELYFSFAAGDKIIFNCFEKDKKQVKEIEILEYPYNSKFSAFDTSIIENKTLHVSTATVYRFRFYNADTSDRKFAINIQRAPSSEETEAFNTNVIWHTEYDTAYYTVQEAYVNKQKYTVQEIIPLTALYIHGGSETISENKSRIIIPVHLPEHTIEWYYRVSFNMVEQTEKAGNLTNELTMLMQKTGGIEFGPLHLKQSPGEAHCDVYVMDSVSANRFQITGDNSYSSIARNRQVKSGVTKMYGGSSKPLYLGIHNPDPDNGVHILLECVAIVMKEEMNIKSVERMNMVSRAVPALDIENNMVGLINFFYFIALQPF